MSDMGDFSLADLADLDVSDIEEIRFVTLPQGVYDFECTRAELLEDEKDGETRFIPTFDLTIRDVHAVLEPDVDRATLLGKVQTERFYIKKNDSKEDVVKSIGRVRAFITDIGQDSAGKLGEIVRNAKGHTFKAAIENQRNKEDPTRPFKRLKLEPKK